MVTTKGRRALKILRDSNGVRENHRGAGWPHAPTQVKSDKPEFYIRLSQEEQSRW